LSKKNLAIKLLLNPRVRRFAIRVLKDPRIRRVIVKLIARQLRRRQDDRFGAKRPAGELRGAGEAVPGVLKRYRKVGLRARCLSGPRAECLRLPPIA
jgi:hypothetical protein